MPQESASEFGERFDRISRELGQSLQRAKDALTFEGLSLAETYVEGRLRIAMEFRAHSALEANGGSLFAVWHYKGQRVEPATGGLPVRIEEVEPLNIHPGLRGDKDVVFVGDVESVDAVELAAPLLEGLYRIKDESLDGRGWRASTLYMSFKGALRTLPVLVEGEECVPVDVAAVGFDQCTVSVIKRRAEIVDHITDDGRCVGRDMTADTALFPAVGVWLGMQGFDVVHHVGMNNRFKLLDVMVGPFYF